MNLRIRSEDPDTNALTGVRIEWDTSRFVNGGEEIVVTGDAIDGLAGGTLYYLYWDGDMQEVVASLLRADTMDHNKMQLGSVLTVTDKNDGTATDENNGGTTTTVRPDPVGP